MVVFRIQESQGFKKIDYVLFSRFLVCWETRKSTGTRAVHRWKDSSWPDNMSRAIPHETLHAHLHWIKSPLRQGQGIRGHDGGRATTSLPFRALVEILMLFLICPNRSQAASKRQQLGMSTPYQSDDPISSSFHSVGKA